MKLKNENNMTQWLRDKRRPFAWVRRALVREAIKMFKLDVKQILI